MPNPNSPSAQRGCVGDVVLRAGDVIVAANDTEQPADFRSGLKGWGRLLHCDAALNVKGEWRTGRPGLVIGALVDSAGRMLATSPQLFQLEGFDAAMTPCAFALPPRRRYGNMVFDRQGGVLVGVHSGYGDPDGPAEADQLGEGKLVRFNPDTGAAESFDVEIDGGRGGKHYVSNLSLAADGKTVFYTSEAGRRVMRYDIEARRQLEDFHRVPEADGASYGVDVDQQGRVLLATGTGVQLMTPEGGLIRRYEASAPTGWTRAAFCVDQSAFFFSNFLDGVLQRRDVETGAVLASLTVGLSASVTTAVEFAPAASPTH